MCLHCIPEKRCRFALSQASNFSLTCKACTEGRTEQMVFGLGINMPFLRRWFVESSVFPIGIDYFGSSSVTRVSRPQSHFVAGILLLLFFPRNLPTHLRNHKRGGRRRTEHVCLVALPMQSARPPQTYLPTTTNGGIH